MPHSCHRVSVRSTDVRFLHTSDWHLGRVIRGASRAAEYRAVLDEIITIADAQRVDLVLIAGDVFDTAAPSPESESIAYAALLRLSEVAPVVVVAGNHDNPRRLEAVAPLLALGGVTVAGRLQPAADGGVKHFDDLGVKVAMLPWQSQRGIVSAADLMAKEGAEHTADYAARMGRIVEALCADMDTDTVNLIVGHLTVHGATATGSERTVHTVIDYSVPTSVFPGSLSYVALGHYHRPQRMPAGPPVYYSGSPIQLDFGESGERKAVNVVTAEPGLPATVETVELASGTPLVRLAGTLEQVEAAAADVPEGAFVRVELDEPPRMGLADAVRAVVPGAVDIVLRASDRRGSPPATPKRLGRDPSTLFGEYLASIDVTDERLRALFDELVEEVHEA